MIEQGLGVSGVGGVTALQARSLRDSTKDLEILLRRVIRQVHPRVAQAGACRCAQGW